MFLRYLWGIETKYALLYLYFYPLSFYATYEELKLNLLRVVFFSYLRFYATYEELKQFICQAFFYFFTRFYATYEELKHIKKSDLDKKISTVFTLPMRNWNK